MRVCDFCFESEVADCDLPHYALRPMYRLDDDCVICQRCLDAGKDKETKRITGREVKR